MEIMAAKQGALHEGCNTPDSIGTYVKEGDPNKILVMAFEKRVSLPVDPQNGMPAGRRRHEGFAITKLFDRASPLLAQALASGERINSVRLEWFRTPPGGGEELYFTHMFEEATIVSIEQFMPNSIEQEGGRVFHLEKVTMTYKRVTWTHAIAGTEGFDEW